MCLRFLQFKDDLSKLALEDSQIGQEVASLLPCAADTLKIIVLEKQLLKFQSISLLLQKHDGQVTLADVRVLFDCLISDFGKDFKHYLASNADIVNNEHFENGIVTALTKGIMSLSTQQKEALQRCVISAQDLTKEKDNGDDDEEVEPSNYAVGILIEGRKQHCLDSNLTQYLDFRMIPVTSNIVEQFFSQVKLNMTAMRNSLLPSTLETIMFLKMNTKVMTPMTVQQALIAIRKTAAAASLIEV